MKMTSSKHTLYFPSPKSAVISTILF